MEKIKISVIVPIYNVEKYLEKCLNTIISQTYKNLEIILIDDGSNDNSGIICDEYAKKDKRIIVIHQKNTGVSSARNKGLKIASGDYIGFIDPDDYIQKNMYEIMLNNILESKSDICICGIKRITEDGIIANITKKQEIREYTKKEILELLIQDKYITTSVWNKLFKSELIKMIEFNENRKVGEDFEFILEALKKLEIRAIYDSKSLYNYLIRKESASRKKNDKHATDILEVNNQLLEMIKRSYPELENMTIERILKRENMILKDFEISKKVEEEIKKDIQKNEKIYLNSKNISIINKGKYIFKKLL